MNRDDVPPRDTAYSLDPLAGLVEVCTSLDTYRGPFGRFAVSRATARSPTAWPSVT